MPESRSASSCDCAWAVGEGRKGVSKGGLGRERERRERERGGKCKIAADRRGKKVSLSGLGSLSGRADLVMTNSTNAGEKSHETQSKCTDLQEQRGRVCAYVDLVESLCVCVCV